LNDDGHQYAKIDSMHASKILVNDLHNIIMIGVVQRDNYEFKLVTTIIIKITCFETSHFKWKKEDKSYNKNLLILIFNGFKGFK